VVMKPREVRAAENIRQGYRTSTVNNLPILTLIVGRGFGQTQPLAQH
jgi:hypothetical protein